MSSQTVESFYDCEPLYEWERLERHRMEFATTWLAMQEYVPKESTILDVGGGPGRYAIALAKQCHRVTLLDLSSANVGLARLKAEEEGIALDGYIHGDALDLGRFTDESFGVVLLMGPLYHLLEADERNRALNEALRVLKPGGILFAGFISRFAFVIDDLRYDPASIGGRPVEREAGFLTAGINIVSPDNPGFTNAFFIHPTEIAPFMQEHGLQPLRLAAAEPFIGPVESRVNNLPQDLFERWVSLCYRLGTDPITWGSAEHMLYVGRKG